MDERLEARTDAERAAREAVIEAQSEVVEAAREFLEAELEYAGRLLKRIDVSEYGDINDQRISAAEDRLREALNNLEEQTDD